LPILAAADEDGDTGVSAPDREATDVAPRTRTAAPNIRKEADSAESAGAGSTRATSNGTPRRAGLFSRGERSNEATQPAAPSGSGFFRRLFRAPQ